MGWFLPVDDFLQESIVKARIEATTAPPVMQRNTIAEVDVISKLARNKLAMNIPTQLRVRTSPHFLPKS